MSIYSKVPGGEPWCTVPALTNEIKLQPDDILVWMDVIFDDDLAEVINTNGKPGLLISSAHDGKFTDLCPVDFWPCFLFHSGVLLEPSMGKYDHNPIEYCANFSINKKQINRYLLIKMVEWFQLESYDYSWSGFGRSFDMSAIISEFEKFPKDLVADLSDFRHHLFSPIEKLQPKWTDYPRSKPNIGVGYECTIGIDWAWNNALGEMISKSAVSLISESVGHQRYAIHTEKTLYALHGLTFPIWIGGYKQAKLWADYGFDIFDDVINHDYQYCDTLLERCTRAFSDNIKILTDLEFAREQKIKNMDRLRKNRELIVPIFRDLDQKFWQRAPAELIAHKPKDRIW